MHAKRWVEVRQARRSRATNGTKLLRVRVLLSPGAIRSGQDRVQIVVLDLLVLPPHMIEDRDYVRLREARSTQSPLVMIGKG